MVKYEIKSFVKIKGRRYDHYMPCGLNIIEKLWWWLMPGVIVKVKWPRGEITVDHNDPRWCDLGGAVRVKLDSADPNDFYRPWMEANIGHQGYDWNWGLVGDDAIENKLTIKVRQSKAKYATMMALNWS